MQDLKPTDQAPEEMVRQVQQISSQVRALQNNITTPISVDNFTRNQPNLRSAGDIVPPIDTNLRNTVNTAGAVSQAVATTQADAQKNMQEDARDIRETLGKIGALGEDRLQLEQDAEFQAKQEKLVSLNAEEMSINKTYDKLIDSELKNPQGKSLSAMNADVRSLERERDDRLADVAIQQYVAQNAYDLAEKTIDAKMNARKDALTLELESRKFFYEENKDFFTSAEQREYDKQLKEEERAYQKQRDDLDFRRDLAKQYISNGGDVKTAINFTNGGSVESLQMGGGDSGATIYDDALQAKLDEGMSPSQAALLTYQELGENLTEKDKTSLVRRAELLAKKPKEEVTAETIATPEKPRSTASFFAEDFGRNLLSNKVYDFLFSK